MKRHWCEEMGDVKNPAIIECTKRAENGDVLGYQSYDYWDNGHIKHELYCCEPDTTSIGHRWYDDDGRLIKARPKTDSPITVYIYDPEHKDCCINEVKEDGTSVSYYREYSDDGLVAEEMEETEYLNDGQLHRSFRRARYDTHGKIILLEKLHDDDAWHTICKYEYTYDDDGKMIEETDILRNNSKTIYEYDDRGNLTHIKGKDGHNITSYFYSLDNKLIYECDYILNTSQQYDYYGNIIRDKYNTLEGDEVVNIYEYEYDSYGNVTMERDISKKETTFYNYIYDFTFAEYQFFYIKGIYVLLAKGLRFSKVDKAHIMSRFPGIKFYELRYYDNDPDSIGEISKRIEVNFYGTVISCYNICDDLLSYADYDYDFVDNGEPNFTTMECPVFTDDYCDYMTIREYYEMMNTKGE